MLDARSYCVVALPRLMRVPRFVACDWLDFGLRASGCLPCISVFTYYISSFGGHESLSLYIFIYLPSVLSPRRLFSCFLFLCRRICLPSLYTLSRLISRFRNEENKFHNTFLTWTPGLLALLQLTSLFSLRKTLEGYIALPGYCCCLRRRRRRRRRQKSARFSYTPLPISDHLLLSLPAATSSSWRRLQLHGSANQSPRAAASARFLRIRCPQARVAVVLSPELPRDILSALLS